MEKAKLQNKVDKPVAKKTKTLDGCKSVEEFAKKKRISLEDAQYFWDKRAK